MSTNIYFMIALLAGGFIEYLIGIENDNKSNKRAGAITIFIALTINALMCIGVIK